jgi:signal transduction histidine kinase
VKQHLHRWRHGIKARLVLLFVLLALATAAVFLAGMQRVLQGGWHVYAKPLVADYVDRLAADIGSPPDVAKAEAITRRLPLAVRIEGPSVNHSTGAARADHQPERPSERWDHGWNLARSTADGHRIHFALTAPPDNQRPRLFGWITLALLLTLTLAAYAAVSRLLRPLHAISAGVQAFGRGDFAQDITVRRNDELGELSRRINHMAHSLKGMLDNKRALLLAISHELRSPLTRARVNAELLEPTPEQQALLRDLAEMRDLITSLLESERLAQGHAALHAQATDLAALARQAAHDAAMPVTLRLDDSLPPVQADPVRIQLLLRNLLANAQRHAAGASSAPELFLRQEADGRHALGLRDHGPGVPPDQLPLLAQAFHRPDAARTRGSGGVGLGLHLCRLVAQAHGGELRIVNAQPGLEVAMVWRPRAPSP